MQHAVFHTIAFLAFSCLAFSSSPVFAHPVSAYDRTLNFLDGPGQTLSLVGSGRVIN